jgi:trimeric autotransporter adhesin
MKPNTFSLVLFALLTYFATTLGVEAVVPPPDGGYPNFTTAEGQNALFSLTSGAANTAVGWFSLKSVTAGSFNTGVGAGTLVLNAGDENTAIGTAALLLNTASGNTAVGSRMLLNNTTGGTLANIQGLDVGPNVAVGQQALESNTIASANTAVGYQALQSFTTGPVGFEQLGLCTAVGFQALASTTGFGAGNSGFGYQALMNNTDGSGNTAIGVQALFSNTTGGGNIAIGNSVLLHNDTGGNNTAIGFGALENNIDGQDNIAIGQHALGANNSGITGGGNIALGAFAGNSITTASLSVSALACSVRMWAIAVISATFGRNRAVPKPCL